MTKKSTGREAWLSDYQDALVQAAGIAYILGLTDHAKTLHELSCQAIGIDTAAHMPLKRKQEGKTMQLITKVKNIAGIGEPEIPAGTQGNVLDIAIDDGKARFLLEFPQYDFIEWYDADEIEDKF